MARAVSMKAKMKLLSLMVATAVCGSVYAQGLNWQAAFSACDREISRFHQFNIARPSADPSFDAGLKDRLLQGFVNESPYERPYWPSKIKRLEEFIKDQESRGNAQQPMINGDYVTLCVYRYMVANSGGQPQAHPLTRGDDSQVSSGSSTSNQNLVFQSALQQMLTRAQEQQSQAEEKRKKEGRRRNRPDLLANDCLQPVTDQPGVSTFRNTCSFPVEYTYCVVGAREGSLAAFVSCTNKYGNRGGGAGSVRAGGEDAAPMKSAKEVHWLACRRPARAITRGFENGKLVGDCIDMGA